MKNGMESRGYGFEGAFDPMDNLTGITRYKGKLVLDENKRIVHVLGVRVDIVEGFSNPGSVVRFHRSDEEKTAAVDWDWLVENLGRDVEVEMSAADNTNGAIATEILIVIKSKEMEEERMFEVGFSI